MELKVPSAGESVTEVQVGEWFKAEGDHVEKDEPVVSIETDKASMEIVAPAAGRLDKVVKRTGESATVGDVLGTIAEGAAAEQRPEPEPKPEAEPAAAAPAEKAERGAAAPPAREAGRPADAPRIEPQPRIMPAAQRALEEHDLRAADVKASGPGGRLLKEDVLRHIARQEARKRERQEQRRAPAPAGRAAAPARARAQAPAAGDGREQEVVRMTPLRRRIAERLVDAQQTAALLTTFNEVDMSGVAALRAAHRDAFQKQHGVKLGLMSFFVKATVDALKRVPQLNAEVRGEEIVYRNYYDVGIAVGGGKGLVVPVLRDAHQLGFAEIELAIQDFARRAADGKLKLEELQGGTFTISNGGVYGSMLSTPIVNPPQSGILGLHAIQDRPVARDGQVVIRPMMYLALTYDHRIVDGREAVTFLRRIKETIEEPARVLLEV